MNWGLPFTIAVLGFIFSTRSWILFIDKLNPLMGLLFYYMILTATVLLLQYFGMVVAGRKYDSFRHTAGAMLIIFAFFVVVDWESCYVNEVARGSCTDKDMSGVYLQAEDGAVYWLWSKVFDDLETRRILTYVVTPFVLAALGSMLITSKISLT